MQQLFLSIQLICVLPLCVFGASITDRDADGETQSADDLNVYNYLERYGYLAGLGGAGGSMHSLDDREQAIKKFQSFNGMEVTGKIDQKTIEKMKQPRCGLPDVRHQSQDAPLAFNAYGYKWDKKVITWKPTRYSSKLSPATQRSIFERAFKKWSDVTPLSFQLTNGKPDIEIKFVSGDHGDGRSYRFDGRGGVLAHAFFPKDGRAHFDADEDWKFRSNGGTDLEIVAAHEFGHALGLGHSGNRKSLMVPFYVAPTPGWKLDYDDILGIQTIYGSPGRGVLTSSPRSNSSPNTSDSTVPTNTPSRTTPAVKYPDNCNIKFDAITFGLDGYAYAFRKNDVYKLSNAGLAPGYPRKAADVFPQAPGYLTAAFQIKALNHVYIIKGNTLWRYTNFQLDAGFPKEMKNFPVGRRINFAVTLLNAWGGEQVYLFGDTLFWEFSKYDNNLIPHPGNPISTYWRGVPNSVEAGIQWTDSYIYLFKGLKYRKLDPKTRSPINGYPKDSPPAWIGGLCGTVPK